MQFAKPTPIQSQAIPLALNGKDILGSAQTGTGKTGAYGIPLVSQLIENPDAQAMVITPTRELAAQVIEQLRAMLGKKSKIRSALLIGGEAMPKQLNQLRSQPRLVVGTPGRINDHLKRKTLKLNALSFLVLDETDRMLDMGFSEQIDEIMKHMDEKPQTLMFSATLPKSILRIAQNYLHEPEHVQVAATSSPAENITQEFLHLRDDEKYPTLLQQLGKREGTVIVFVKTKTDSEKIARKLGQDGLQADAIHGDLRQNQRNRVISAFRNKKYRILVATDVAARGLDIPHIAHVINFDLPQCPEDYIHRIGRTARAGAKGEALNFIAPSERGKWKAIDRLLNPDQPREEKKPRRARPNNPQNRAQKAKKPFHRGGKKRPGSFKKAS
ncbi:MAG: DEAD/DEAH box helicase [Alphaproteobacteria bacterium]|nr:DEAD/DEAH box helicase [Alphaproteobacteria bacterium]